MSKWDKLLEDVLRGTGDANIAYADLCALLIRLGFDQRTRGSHVIFRKTGIMEKPNLQRDGVNAKAYQVRQVRDIIVKYQLGETLKWNDTKS